MKKSFITTNSKQTKKLGEILAKELRGGAIICLAGELGSGKTTFTQGVLKGLGAKGPYTSPTFVVIKQYKLKTQNSKLENVYHIDAYRISAQNVLALGWEEIVADKKNIVIVEWAERIRKIIPKYAIWMKFRHVKNNVREIKIN